MLLAGKSITHTHDINRLLSEPLTYYWRFYRLLQIRLTEHCRQDTQ